MRRNLRYLLIAAAWGHAALPAAAGEEPVYTLGTPGVPILCVGADPDNSWLASNACYVAQSFEYVRTNAVVECERETDPSAPLRSLASASVGFSIERNKPEYYLGDALNPPEGVDWDETYALYDESESKDNFLFDTKNRIVYVVEGETSRFRWIVDNGSVTTQEVSIVASPVSSDRPKNIFWTDNGGKTVDLTGKYVKFYGPSNILTKVMGKKETGTTIGDSPSYQEYVVSGLYIDETGGTKTLYAAGQIEGEVVMVYYDSANYDRIVGVQTLKVSSPSVEILNSNVGSELKPTGRGYSTDGLLASPMNMDDEDDGKGPYLYQHSGTYSYSPKNKSVFALRPTDDKTRNRTQICWMETDYQGVQWPFEFDEYLVSWSAKAEILVRGDDASDPGKGITIPSAFDAELMKYQEDLGSVANHARAPSDGEFRTYGPGLSLLKLTADDNIWFLPVRSVLRTDPEWFAPFPVWYNVGEELELNGGDAVGIAEGREEWFDIDSSLPGYIYEPESDRVWNKDLYSESGTGSGGLTSAVFAVTASMDESVTNRMEVWWSAAYRESGMPAALSIPKLAQRYLISWPQDFEVPAITLASQLGSAGQSVFLDGRALRFFTTDSTLKINNRKFFSEHGGSVGLWCGRVLEAEVEGSSRLLTFGDKSGAEFITVEVSDSDRYTLRFGSSDPVTVQGGAGESKWDYLCLYWVGTNACFFAMNYDNFGIASANFTLSDSDRSAAAEVLAGSSLGATANSPAAVNRLVDKVVCYNYLSEENDNKLALTDDYTAGCTLSVDFDQATEHILGASAAEKDCVYVSDDVTGAVFEGFECTLYKPGSPRLDTCVIASDTTPVVYRENDKSAVGYNPNEEHAFVTAGDGGYIVWALRCDLNAKGGVSEPGVLVSYSQNGKAKMRYFNVEPTNFIYTTLGADCTVGRILPGPHPLDTFADPWLKDTHWQETALPPFRDRKGQVWAKEAGEFDIYMYYAQQDTFDWPGMTTPAVGDPVAWLAYLDSSTAGKPYPWHWSVAWPAPDDCATMKIGQTLTTAENDLPEMWNAKSMAVLYPENDGGDTVMLSDPTVAVKADCDVTTADLKEIGLEATSDGKLIEKQSMYYFRDVSPSLSDRLYFDPTSKKLCLKGKMESNTGGINLLHVNVLTQANVDEVLANIDSSFASKEAYLKLKSALEEILATGPIFPTAVGKRIVNQKEEFVDTYTAPDHYALTALGDTNWVVVIENNATNRFCDAGNPINMHVFRVKDEYYTGRIAMREDPLNKLSQILGVHYSANFGGYADDYLFEWRKAAPGSDGTVPTDYANLYTVAFTTNNAYGKTEFTIGGQGDTLENMVNTYWTCRYQARPGTAAYATMGDKWSDWADAALAEGWVQRVLNNITPFTQRMTDLYENAAETSISMIKQAGAPYTGDVALNQDNLTSVGLIQLYRTILNKAKSMSVDQGVNNDAANKQLLLAVQRLADLYKVLGDEAYADALNPTIAFAFTADELALGLNDEVDAIEPGRTFCFDNQVPTLLDEELALLRGRSCVNAPGNKVGPYYNRLIWNFTKDMTAGEVAYAVNYGISGHRSSTIDETTAAEMYPQGHGDAYGHYLSALSGYYELLRHPYFSWGVAGMSEMNVADNVVNVDYYDEETFAETAAAVAKAARRTVELTAIKAWRDNGADTVGGGYLDSNTTNAFGYGEWATRGGYGALCNWVVANSLLPEEETTDDTGAAYTDKGLLRIDRGTVEGIGELSSAAEAIQSTLDRMDSGLNPIGLDEDAIPFDLTPLGTATADTHFEQIRKRAKTAYENAESVLASANEYANRLKLIQESETGLVDSLDAAEDDASAQLIAIYGRPYTDDCGPSGTYPQDYYGPDRYHYMWMDLSKFGLTSVEDTMCVTTVTYKIKSYSSNGAIAEFSTDTDFSNGNALAYSLSATGVVLKDENIKGERPAAGSLQQAYADFLSAYASVELKKAAAERATERMNAELTLAKSKWDALCTRNTALKYLDDDDGSIMQNAKKLASAKQATAAFDAIMANSQFSSDEGGHVSGTVGLATTLLADSGHVAIDLAIGLVYMVASAGKAWSESLAADYEKWMKYYELKVQKADYVYATATDTADIWSQAFDAVDNQAAAIGEYREAWCAFESAQLAVSKLVQDAKAIEEGIELTRQQAVNQIAKLRYKDMLFRQTRNEALTKYETSFELARKYAFLTLKAYAYETGCSLDSSDTGKDLVRSLVGARSLGDIDDVLSQLDANWDNLKPQLGLNNPQPYATWVSLRHGLFRILTDETGDSAWAKELSKYWVEDIKSDPEFLRHCQPFASQFGTAEKEPALVIPFETTIDFACNLFGKPLCFDDKQFDSTWYSTKISSAGVWFEGYNDKRSGYTGQSAFALTPNVYLVPVGTDRMRVPGTDGADIADFNVVDQTIPVPYPITAAEIAEANWLPTYSGELGGTDTETRIRRHPSFRAYFGARGDSPADAQLDATRLTGRSVWNTRWLLVIPAGTLASDRETALKAFINGLDTDYDGVIDVLPVKDIHVGFKTYSNSGK